MGDLNTAEDFISTSSIINNTAFLNLDNTIADTILESLETSPDQQYLPFAHIKDDKDKKDKQKDKDGTIIIHSTTQLMGLFDDGSIIPSRKGETTQTDAILIANDILYRSDDNQLQVTLPKDLVIQKYDGEPFNPQGLELQKNTGEESMAIVQRYDPAMNTYTPIDTIPIVNEDQFEFHFGIS